jgi:hypothetical protein
VNPEAVLRRSVYRATGGYDPHFPHAGDMYLWLQAAAVSDVGYIGGPRQAYYRDHGGNMHSVEFGGVLDDTAQTLDVYARFFATDGSRLPDAERLLRRAVASTTREALLRAALLSSQGAPPATLRAVQEFVRDVDPGMERTLSWRWAASDPTRQHLVATVERARWMVRSRRHAVLGL